MDIKDDSTLIAALVFMFIATALSGGDPIVAYGTAGIVILVMISSNKARKQWRKERADGKYCKSCGAATYITQIRKGYDSKTGKPILEDYRDCPNIKHGYKVDTHPLDYDF